MIHKDYPDHHDADLVIKLYDLRREQTMRESRGAINGQFWPTSADDVAAIVKNDHPLNAAWRQVGTYWEMVYSMAKHGIIHADFLMESSSEGLLLFAKVEPYLEQIRQGYPSAFRNAEWMVTNCESGKRALERYRKLVAARATAGR